jgi:polysaccharide chain length determinant protein (PEP-CTERM system associated)
MDSFNFREYLDIAVRRIYWIIIPFLIILLGGFYYILETPKIYQASTLILVQAQKVPENYVRSTVTTSVQDRLRTIEQQVTSRTNLENIIKECKLFDQPPENKMLTEEKVALVKKQIGINVANPSGGESAFSISFIGKDPVKITQVTNALASNFISENLKIRESQAFGTSDFLINELETVRIKLEEKEKQLKAYKEKYMGGLPEQLDANLKILDRLQIQLDQLKNNLKTDEDKLAALQQPVAAVGQLVAIPSTLNNVPSGQSADENNIFALKKELASLQARYTDSYPDIIQLKNKIAILEKTQSSSVSASSSDSTTQPKASSPQIAGNNRSRQKEIDIRNEISSIKAEITKTEADIDWYQTKVKDTPTRAQEMLSLNRDYNNLNNQYNTLLNKELESELSLSMEKKQQGEQFKIIDPAKVPVKPIKPNIQKLALLILVLGVGVGCCLAYLIEFMDTSYKSLLEIEKDLTIPVLITMPTIYSQAEVLKKKWRKILAIASISIGFVFCTVCIVIAVKGTAFTVNYLKIIFNNV